MLPPGGDDGTTGRISGASRRTVVPEFKIERRPGNRVLDFLPDTPQLGLHVCWHRLIRVRSQPSQDPLAAHIIGKTRHDVLPARPEGPTPTAHGIMEVVKRKRHS
jgi:hypothetical protein